VQSFISFIYLIALENQLSNSISILVASFCPMGQIAREILIAGRIRNFDKRNERKIFMNEIQIKTLFKAI
jgi:hypothetical protein